MPKDNENFLLPLDGPITPSEPAGFAPAEMIRCEECLRANPPTRALCMYCSAALPITESSASLRRPNLLTPDKACVANNIILSGQYQTSNYLNEAAEFVKLDVAEFEKIVRAKQPLPLARTVSMEEAKLVAQKLAEFGFDIMIVSDHELGVESSLTRVRRIVFDETSFWVHSSGGAQPTLLNFADLILLVQARLLTKMTALKERQTRSSENEILEASEFYSDESVMDLYSSKHTHTYRIAANSFDFSCLGNAKELVVNENMSTLTRTFVTSAPQMLVDHSYGNVRQMLDLVWGSEKSTRSAGWRREAPGRVTVGATTTDSKENQFTRYSRLKYHLQKATITNARS